MHPQKAKANVVVPEGRVVVVPEGATRIVWSVVPTPAPDHPAGTAIMIYGIVFI